MSHQISNIDKIRPSHRGRIETNVSTQSKGPQFIGWILRAGQGARAFHVARSVQRCGKSTD
ncbi:hypothetical protein HYPGJ_20461 [Hyphomicrobium sp. GJ21]|nr:hypothetical protein HYPGJ_20461 [Hyphomicrobium sp. GJ21]